MDGRLRPEVQFYARTIYFFRDINGHWYNGEICTEAETDEEEVEIDLIEIGNAKPSEEEDN